MTSILSIRPGPLRWGRAVAIAVPVAVFTFTGCSSNSAEVAESRVCTAQAEVSSNYNELVSNVKAANFGDASTSLTALSNSLNDLESADQTLDEVQKQEVQGEVDKLKSTLSSLGGASSLEELGRKLDDSATQMQSVIDSIKTTANC